MSAVQTEVDHAGADGIVADAVNQYESPGFRVISVGIKRNRLCGGKIAHGNSVQIYLICRQMFGGIDIDGVFQIGNLYRSRLCADFKHIATFRQHRVFVHPDQVCLELVAAFQWLTWSVQNVTLADINFIFQCKGHGIALAGARQIAIHGDDRFDATAF